MKGIETVIRRKIEQVQAKVGIGFKHLKTGETFFYNGDDRFLAASTFKVPVLVEFYNQVIQGKLDLNRTYTLKKEDMIFGSGVLRELTPGLSLTLKDYATLMMIISDNTATDIITNMVGKENVNATVAKLGLSNTKVTMTCKELLYDAIGIKPDDDEQTVKAKLVNPSLDLKARCFTDFENNNVTSPADMVELFDSIYHHRILNDFACDEMVNIMKRCQTNWRIPRYLPANVQVSHKTGSIAGVANDVGIVYTDRGNYILAIYYHGEAPEYRFNLKGFDFIADLSREIFGYVMSG